jgi:DNA-binding NtrC family response regulator
VTSGAATTAARVLIVDDDMSVTDTLSRMLRLARNLLTHPVRETT